jgi:hypothetical protein
MLSRSAKEASRASSGLSAVLAANCRRFGPPGLAVTAPRGSLNEDLTINIMKKGCAMRWGFVRLVGYALVMCAAVSSVRAAEIRPEVADAELVLRIAAENRAVAIQNQVSLSINQVMARRPATTFNVRNAIRAAGNAINGVARTVRVEFAEVLQRVLDDLIDAGVPRGEVSLISDAFDTEVDANLVRLSREGVDDVSSLLRGARRIASVRGTFAGRYELSVSLPGGNRAEAKLGRILLTDGNNIRGRISTDAAIEFFLGPLPGPTPVIRDLPDTVLLRAVRWLSRAGAMVVSTKDGRADTFAGVDAQEFSITGVDLLPVRLRVELERRLAGTSDITSNPDGADGFFKSVTYTFRRVRE